MRFYLASEDTARGKSQLANAGSSLWATLTAPFGWPNGLDAIGEVFGVLRRRGPILWETNHSYRERIRLTVFPSRPNGYP